MPAREVTDEARRQQPAVSSATVKARLTPDAWLWAWALVTITFLAYQPVQHAGFVWDDGLYFAENPLMLSTAGFKHIWSSLYASRFVPLTMTSFWLERRFWSLHPLPYHAVNVALHASNAVLLWTLLRRLKIRGAWLAAAAWALHPVNTETVAWVSELKNTQSGFFFLLALLMFLRFEEGSRPLDYAATLVLGTAAMLSKPSTVVLPGVMLLCAWWQRGRWVRNDFLQAAPLMAFGVVMSLVAIVEQRMEIAPERGASEWALTIAQRTVLAGRAPWFYAGRVLWPAHLCFVYPRWELVEHSALEWLPLAAVALAAVTLWQFRHARWAKALIFGLGYFMIALLPVLGLVDTYFFRYSFVADRFQYLPCIGLISLVVGTAAEVFERAGRRHRTLGVTIAAAVLLVLGMATWSQAHIYRDSQTLWSDTLRKNPGCWAAHNDLGLALVEQGRLQEAIGHYQQALQFCSDAQVHNNMGFALMRQGRLQEAMGHYQQALQLRPDYPELHNNMGVALARQGRFQEAMGHYQQALQLRPAYAEAHNNLGIALFRLGQVQEAMVHWERALEIKPDYAEAHNNMGNALLKLGDVQKAIEHYEQALRINPDYAQAQRNLAGARDALARRAATP
jgi:Tfp pilus assembly protein PilF